MKPLKWRGWRRVQVGRCDTKTHIANLPREPLRSPVEPPGKAVQAGPETDRPHRNRGPDKPRRTAHGETRPGGNRRTETHKPDGQHPTTRAGTGAGATTTGPRANTKTRGADPQTRGEQGPHGARRKMCGVRHRHHGKGARPPLHPRSTTEVARDCDLQPEPVERGENDPRAAHGRGERAVHHSPLGRAADPVRTDARRSARGALMAGRTGTGRPQKRPRDRQDHHCPAARAGPPGVATPGPGLCRGCERRAGVLAVGHSCRRPGREQPARPSHPAGPRPGDRPPCGQTLGQGGGGSCAGAVGAAL